MEAPEAYPQGYVEDAFEARTKLTSFFSIRLVRSGCRESRRMTSATGERTSQYRRP
jgi:hypothetical protein